MTANRQTKQETKMYILNSPILTDYGQWNFKGPMSIEEARSALQSGYISAIGHQASATFLSRVLEVPVEHSRISIKMQSGDSALVFRLLERLPENVLLNEVNLEKIPFEFGILNKI